MRGVAAPGDEPELKDDPILTPQQWFPVFRAFVLQYYREHPDHDRLWLKDDHRELYQRIVAQEHKIDALGTVKLSELMGHLREWRDLMLQAEFATAERHRHGAPGWPNREELVPAMRLLQSRPSNWTV